MNIYLSSPAFCYNSITQNARDFSQHFKHWEIVSEYNNDILLHHRELREVMGSYDMKFRVHAPFSDINTASVNRVVRDFSQRRIFDNIKICSELGIQVITVHPGWKNPITRFGPNIVPQLNGEFVKALDRAQEEYGVQVGFENMPYGSKLDCTNLDEMMRALEGTNVHLTLDIGHAFMENALAGFYTIKDRIVNVHIHDNMGSKDEHLVLGDGKCDLKDVLSKLLPIKNSHFKDSLVIESNGFDDAVKSKAYLEKLLEGLQF